MSGSVPAAPGGEVTRRADVPDGAVHPATDTTPGTEAPTAPAPRTAPTASELSAIEVPAASGPGGHGSDPRLGGRENWAALPRRRHRLPALLHVPPLRRPVTPRTRWVLRTLSIAVPLLTGL